MELFETSGKTLGGTIMGSVTMLIEIKLRNVVVLNLRVKLGQG